VYLQLRILDLGITPSWPTVSVAVGSH